MSRNWNGSAACRCSLPSAEQAWRQGFRDGDTWHCGTPGCGRRWTLHVLATVGGHATSLYTRVSWS